MCSVVWYLPYYCGQPWAACRQDQQYTEACEQVRQKYCPSLSRSLNFHLQEQNHHPVGFKSTSSCPRPAIMSGASGAGGVRRRRTDQASKTVAGVGRDGRVGAWSALTYAGRTHRLRPQPASITWPGYHSLPPSPGQDTTTRGPQPTSPTWPCQFSINTNPSDILCLISTTFITALIYTGYRLPPRGPAATIEYVPWCCRKSHCLCHH